MIFSRAFDTQLVHYAKKIRFGCDKDHITGLANWCVAEMQQCRICSYKASID